YEPIVKAICQALAPSYLYDLGVAGQSTGAAICRQLGVPYIFDYRGAGQAAREALGAAEPFYPEIYAQAEELALRQAAVVVVATPQLKEELAARGIDAARVVMAPCGKVAAVLGAWIDEQGRRPRSAASLETGDAYKDRVQDQWNQNPVGSQHARASQ